MLRISSLFYTIATAYNDAQPVYYNMKLLTSILAAAAFLLSASIQAQAQSPGTDFTRQQWHARLGWETQDCPLASPAANDSGVQVFEFERKLTLIQVDCRHLAYQATYLYYLQKGEQVVQQKFRQFESLDTGQLDAYTAPLVTGLPIIQIAAKALFILRKYRGYGDCGQYLEYRLEGSNFALKQLRVNECTETFPEKVIPPQNWPVRNKPIAPRH